MRIQRRRCELTRGRQFRQDRFSEWRSRYDEGYLPVLGRRQLHEENNKFIKTKYGKPWVANFSELGKIEIVLYYDVAYYVKFIIDLISFARCHIEAHQMPNMENSRAGPSPENQRKWDRINAMLVKAGGFLEEADYDTEKIYRSFKTVTEMAKFAKSKMGVNLEMLARMTYASGRVVQA